MKTVDAQPTAIMSSIEFAVLPFVRCFMMMGYGRDDHAA